MFPNLRGLEHLPALCVNPLTANFDAQYADEFGAPVFPAIEHAPSIPTHTPNWDLVLEQEL